MDSNHRRGQEEKSLSPTEDWVPLETAVYILRESQCPVPWFHMVLRKQINILHNSDIYSKPLIFMHSY
jgi:uncharacterized cysteine cluster protein YcgN (CxxCxxCC family)